MRKYTDIFFRQSLCLCEYLKLVVRTETRDVNTASCYSISNDTTSHSHHPTNMRAILQLWMIIPFVTIRILDSWFGWSLFCSIHTQSISMEVGSVIICTSCTLLCSCVAALYGHVHRCVISEVLAVPLQPRFTETGANTASKYTWSYCEIKRTI